MDVVFAALNGQNRSKYDETNHPLAGAGRTAFACARRQAVSGAL